MADQATRLAERSADPRAEVERYRRGEPTRGPLLWEAGLWETPADALAALNAGHWKPAACGFCKGDGAEVRIMCGEIPEQCDRPFDDYPNGDPQPCGQCQVAGAPGCPVCLGTGLSWSTRHAELAAYAGEELPRYGLLDLARVQGDAHSDSATRLSRHLSRYGPVPPVVAARGVVREWLRWRWGKRIPPLTGKGMSTNERRACDRALDAVERWTWEPNEANRLVCIATLEIAFLGLTPLVHLLDAAADNNPGGDSIGDTIRGCFERGLPEDQAAQAARAAVRRWALAGLMGSGESGSRS